ncbi:MAG: hypothetical protein OHK0040_14360 [bacterium]
MKRFTFTLLFVFLASLAFAEESFDRAFKNAESAVISEQNKGLKSYICDVKTSQFDIMMKKMTAAMPENLPRPEKPVIKKYWHKDKGMVIRLEGKNIFPYMKEVSKKMSEQFALDLYGYFLPKEGKQLRDKLLKTADKKLEMVSGYHRFTITFKEKTDIKNAFFKGGLPIPTQDVKSITISVDMEKRLVKDIYIQYDKAEGYKEYKLLAEYKKIDNKYFLYNLYLMADDHSVMIGFRTDFDKIGDYYLPVKQIRTGEGPEVQEEEKRIEVEFVNYKINAPIPAGVFGKSGKK